MKKMKILFSLPSQIKIKSFSISTMTENQVLSVKSTKAKIFFFGNEDFSLPSLKYLYKRKYIKTLSSKENPDIDVSDIEIVSTPVVNNNKKQSVFHSFVLEKGIKQYNILNENWKTLLDSVEACRNTISCLGILVSFGKMIPNSVIDAFSMNGNLGLFILHPSLLPEYKGGAPIHHVLLNKEEHTGVSLISTSKEKYDSGRVFLQRKVEIFPYFRYRELSNVLSEECKVILSEFIDDFNMIISKEPSQLNVSNPENKKLKYAKIIKEKEKSFLDFANQSTDVTMCIYKAFYGSNQEPWTYFQYGIHKKHLFFDNLFVANSSISTILENDSIVKKYVKPGSLYWDFKLDNENLYIKTFSGWVVSSKVKIEGLDYLNSQDFVMKVLKNQKIDKQKGSTFGYIVNK